MAKQPNLTEVAKKVVKFYRDNAGVGHTKAVVSGAERSQANILVVEEGQKTLKGIKGRKQISFEEVMAGQLDANLVQGWPLLLDNGAVVALLEHFLAAKPATVLEKVTGAKKDTK